MARTVRNYAAGVWTRRLAPPLFAAMLCCAGSPACFAVSLETVVDRSSGEVFLKNATAGVETFDGYSLFSPTGAFLTGNWTTITSSYDLSGDQSVDDSAEWFVLFQSTSFLSEVSTVELSGSLGPGEFVSLGEVWNTGGVEAIGVTLSEGVTTTDVIADFRDLDADYDGDLDVDLDDLAVFTSTLGSSTLLDADGNNDGVVDAADFTVWRDSPELSLPATSQVADAPAPSTATSVFAIPEPSAMLIGLVGAASAALPGRNRNS